MSHSADMVVRMIKINLTGIHRNIGFPFQFYILINKVCAITFLPTTFINLYFRLSFFYAYVIGVHVEAVGHERNQLSRKVQYPVYKIRSVFTKQIQLKTLQSEIHFVVKRKLPSSQTTNIIVNLYFPWYYYQLNLFFF